MAKSEDTKTIVTLSENTHNIVIDEQANRKKNRAENASVKAIATEFVALGAETFEKNKAVNIKQTTT